MLVPAGVAKGNAMRGILQALLSDSYQSSLADRGGVPLPQDVVRFTIVSPTFWPLAASQAFHCFM